MLKFATGSVSTDDSSAGDRHKSRSVSDDGDVQICVSGGANDDDDGGTSSPNHLTNNRLLSLPHFPDRTPLRSSLVKDGSRRNSPARKTVSFTRMPDEKKISNVNDCLAHMTAGAEMTKVRANTRQYRRHFTLDADFSYLRWTPTNKKPHKAKIRIPDIKEIRLGRNTEVLRTTDAGAIDKQDDCAFSIIYGDLYECLDLIATGPEQANIWVTGLMALLSGNPVTPLPASVDSQNASGGGEPAVASCSGTIRERWLAEQFTLADGGRLGFLTEKAAVRLVKQLNPLLAVNRIKLKFKEIESTKVEAERGRIQVAEFVDAYRDVATRPEVYFLMVRYANKDYLTCQDLQLFLENEQGIMNVTQELCQSIIQQHEPSEEGRNTDTMTVDGFTQYLLAEECSLFDPSHREAACQDMSHPLNDYFIAASHNTYLVEDQLKGPSSSDGYISALKRNCRFIELDVWEAENESEIFVHNGHTLTSKLPVSKALKAIKEYAFETTEYPLIIKVEQHLSLPNQSILASYLKDAFKEQLVMADSFDCDSLLSQRLPSPESLKRRVLLMGKRLSDACVEDVGEVTEDDESAETQRSSVRIKRDYQKKMPLSRALSDLICPFMKSFYLKDIAQIESLSPTEHVCNMNESQCLRMMHAGTGADFRCGVSGAFVCRAYPNTLRVDSSNMNPQEFWNYGVQLVALNYQTPGLMMDLQDGKFQANGYCGYVLKPLAMRVPSAAAACDPTTVDNVFAGGVAGLPPSSTSLTPQILHLKIISAQQLPRPRGSTAKGDSSDPFIVVEVFGVPIDCAEERTKTVKNDSFNPSFDESFQFQITVPELALIRFLILDDDYIGDDFIGQYTIPFECLQSGYRHINLLNNEGESMEGVTLFVHVAVTNRRGGGKAKKRGMSVKRKTQRTHTGVKMIGVKRLDELFKNAIVPLAECIQLRSALETALAEWQEQCGLGATGTMRQGLRQLNTRILSAAATNGSDSISTFYPTKKPVSDEDIKLEIWIDSNELPHVECKGPLPEQLVKQYNCLDDLLSKGRNILDKTEQLLQKLEEATRRISESYEELSNLCLCAGLKGQKATRATENFAWNLRLLKAQLDVMYRTQQEVRSTNQQVIDSACVLDILRVKCTQPCTHQSTATRITI